ncbi:MAG: amidohydrolase family protein [Candidatus Marinimicrobia bacterium]|nr:amidohydrolase family protein [Candidatus Neomarinimicrobiota bacterium]MCF7880580.1 amidohydrolase family protein [Candidatus Neomarinimicrobiota bacterium]
MGQRLKFVILLAVGLGLSILANAQPEPMYIEGGTIYTLNDEIIENGIIRLENGKITYVGRRITIPKDAIVLEAVGKYITPGFILANTTLGLDTDNETDLVNRQPITPGFRMMDVVDISNPAFSEAILHGITAANIMPQPDRPIPGVGTLVKTAGDRYLDRVVNEMSALSINLIRASHPNVQARERSLASEVESIILIRNWLREANRIREAREDFQSGYSDFDIDGHTQMLIRTINQEIPVFIYANTPTEIERGLSLREDYDFSPVFVGMEQIDMFWERFSDWQPQIITGPLTQYNPEGFLPAVSIEKADSLFQRNFRFHLQVDQYNDDGLAGVQNLVYQAALLQRLGMSTEQALKTITTIPAEMLHVEDRLGTIEVGKDADLNIFSEPPLESLSLPDIVMVNGHIVNESYR